MLFGDDAAIVVEAAPLLEETDLEVILERDGVNFINQTIFFPDSQTEENLDHDFRDLVDSVISVNNA